MPIPNLTFFCELEVEPLQALLNDQVISDLKHLSAGVSLGLLDLSQERAEVVKRLNEAGVPLTAWLLLPKEEGYWFNLRNGPQAVQRYLAFREWSLKNGLKWEGIGLDIEPDLRELEGIKNRNWGSIPGFLMRLFARRELKRGQDMYRYLVDQIHADGYWVESYQFPIIEDERKAHSTLFQRVIGIVDLPVDREVWMLYTSLVRPHGSGMLGSYAENAQAIALGSTGGGVELGDSQPLTWDELARDLRLAWYWCNDVYIFSLEGCVRQGYLEQLKQFSWDYPVILPETSIVRVDGWRRSLQSALWFFSHLGLLVSIGLSVFLIWRITTNFISKKKKG